MFLAPALLRVEGLQAFFVVLEDSLHFREVDGDAIDFALDPAISFRDLAGHSGKFCGCAAELRDGFCDFATSLPRVAWRSPVAPTLTRIVFQTGAGYLTSDSRPFREIL